MHVHVVHRTRKHLLVCTTCSAPEISCIADLLQSLGQLTAEDVAKGMSIDETSRSFWKCMFRQRGSEQFFQAMRNDVESMVRTLGPPAFFLTLGPKEKEWIDLLVSLIRAECFAIDPAITEDELAKEVAVQLEELDAVVESELRELNAASDEKIKMNFRRTAPERLISRMSQGARGYIHATLRHFYNRIRKFRKWLLHNDTVLGGKVHDFFIRIEFQDRGFPHAHCLVWVAGSPDAQTEAGAERAMQEYVDSCIRTDRAEGEPEELWTDLQYHCHTFTCKKYYHAKCRFDYPRPTSSVTRLSQTNDGMSRARWYTEKRTEANANVVSYLHYWLGGGYWSSHSFAPCVPKRTSTYCMMELDFLPNLQLLTLLALFDVHQIQVAPSSQISVI